MSKRLEYSDVANPQINEKLKQLSEDFKKTGKSIVESIEKLRKSTKSYSEKVKEQNNIEKKSITVKKKYHKEVSGLLKQKIKEDQTRQKESKRLAESRKKQLQKIKAIRGETGSIQRLEYHIKTLTKFRKQQNLQTENGRKRFKQLTSQIQRLNTQKKEYNKGLVPATKKTGGLAKSIKNAVLQFGAMYLSVFAVIRIFKNLIGTIVDFEKSFTNVLTLLDEDTIANYGDTLRQASIDQIRLGFAIEDTNKALFDAVSAGVSAGESQEFMAQASRLAIGGVTSLSTSVDGLTSIINSYGLSIDETEKVASAFFSAQKFGKTTVDELASSIGKVAPIAKQAGLSYQELLSTFAELTKQGIKTEDSATAIKATVLALIKPNEAARKTFKSLGIEVGANAVKQQGLMNILVKVSQAAEENADVLSELIPNVRALTGVGALGTEQLKEYDEILKVVNEDYGDNSSLAKAVAKQQDTLSQKTKELGGAWRALVLSIEKGDSFLGKFVKRLVDDTAKALDAIRIKLEVVSVAFESIFGGKQQTILRLSLESGRKEFENFSDNIKELTEDTTIEIAKNIAERNRLTDENAAKFKETLLRERLLFIQTKKDELKADEEAKKKQLELEKQLQENIRKQKIKAVEEDEKARQKELKKQQKENERILKEQEKFRKQFEKENEELLRNIKQQELQSFQDKQALDKSSFDLRIKQMRQQGVSEQEIAKETKRFEILQAIETLEFLRITGKQQNAVQIQLMKDLITGFEIELQELDNIKRPRIQELLGLTDEQFANAKQAATTFLNEMGSILSAIAQNQIDAAQRQIDESNRILESLEDDRRSAEERIAEGGAANIEEIDRQIAQEKAIRDKAEKDRQKAVKTQQQLDTIAQISSMITAISQVIKGFSIIPIVGAPLGIAAAIAMVAAYTKLKLEQRKNLAEGEIMIDGKGTETSDSITANLSKNESVIKAKSTKRSIKTLTNINDGIWTDKDILPAMKLYNSFNPDNEITRYFNYSLSERKEKSKEDINTKLLKENIELQRRILNRKGIFVDNTGKTYKINYDTGMILVQEK